MDFANRGNRPVQATQAAVDTNSSQAAPAFQPVKSSSNNKKSSKFDFGKVSSIFMLIAGSLLLLGIIAALVFGTNVNSESDLIQSDKYQAVFLNSQDGQVYFGKLNVYNDSLYKLTDIYYVRVDNPIQPQGVDQQAAQPNISLAKLGNELHGPQDMMFVSRDKVLYWENLKDDGQVVTAITKYKADGGNSQTPAADPTPASGTPAPAAANPTPAPATGTPAP